MTPEADSGESIQRRGPATGDAVADRFSTDEIFQRVVATAYEVVDARPRVLYLSAFSAGLAITITFFAYARVSTAAAPDPTGLVGPLLYPLGFVYIIIGRYQLYTENTLTPVSLVLTRVRSVPSLLRVWALVLAGNASGAILGAVVLATSGVFDPASATTATRIGIDAIETPWLDLLFKAVFAGWLVAGVVWLDHAVESSISRVVLVYVVIYTIPVTDLNHVVVSISELSYLVVRGEASLVVGLWEFVIPVLLGNTLGGVFLVTVLNFGQLGRSSPVADQQRLDLTTWLFGRIFK